MKQGEESSPAEFSPYPAPEVFRLQPPAALGISPVVFEHAPRSGGVAERVGEARFREPLLPQGATIAKPAGSTVGCRLVA